VAVRHEGDVGGAAVKGGPVVAEAEWDGNVPRLVDPRKYRAQSMAKRWPVGTKLKITVQPPTRSERANGYYWGVVIEHIERLSESGYSAQELHDVFCERFILCERKQAEFYNKMTGERVITEYSARRSSALTGGPFYDFVENVRLFAREFWGIETPDPDPEYWRKPRDKRKAA
jgi:hypothetical protein